jgi:hypothetical protein
MGAFEILATLEGIALGKPTESTVGEVPLRTLRTNRLINANYLKRLPEEPEPVWCPSTALGTWVMRDASGTISITHNTRAKARALRDAINVGVTSLEEFSDGEVEAPQRRAPQQAPRQAPQWPRQLAVVGGGEQETETPAGEPGDWRVPESQRGTPKQIGFLKGLIDQDPSYDREEIETRRGPVEEWSGERVSDLIEKLKAAAERRKTSV